MKDDKKLNDLLLQYQDLLDREEKFLSAHKRSNELAKLFFAIVSFGVVTTTISCFFGDIIFDNPVFLLNFFPNFFIIDTAQPFYTNSIIVSFFLFYTIIICSCGWLYLLYTREKNVGYHNAHKFFKMTDDEKIEYLKKDRKNRFYFFIFSIFMFYFMYSQIDGVFIFSPINDIFTLWKICVAISIFFPMAISFTLFTITPKSLSNKIGDYLFKLFEK